MVGAASKLAGNKYSPFVIGGIALVIIGVTYFGIARPILKATGVIKGKDGKKSAKEEIKSIDLNKKMLTIDESKAKAIANIVYKGVKGAGTSTSSIIEAFEIPYTNAIIYHNYDVNKSTFTAEDLKMIKKEFDVRDGMTMGQWLNDEYSNVAYNALSELYSSRGLTL